MDWTGLASLIVSVPVLTGVTSVLKGLVPDRFRALVPLVLGIVLSIALTRLTGMDMTGAVLAGLGLGGVASSTRDLVRDHTVR